AHRVTERESLTHIHTHAHTHTHMHTHIHTHTHTRTHTYTHTHTHRHTHTHTQTHTHTHTHTHKRPVCLHDTAKPWPDGQSPCPVCVGVEGSQPCGLLSLEIGRAAC